MTAAKKSFDKLCACGRAPIFPGEEQCHLCLGIDPPKEITPEDDYIGSEEWKEEVRYWWPRLFPKAPSTPNSPYEAIVGTTTA